MANNKLKSKKDKSSMSNLALLGVGLLSFVLTVGASATGTYAWFTLNKFASISFAEFKLNEQAEMKIGLKNSYGTIDYFDDITDEDLTNYYVGYQPGTALADVSSMYQDLWLNDSTDYEYDVPTLRSAYSGSNTKESTRAYSGYLQFEFYFLAQQNMYLFLDSDATKVEALHQANVDYCANNPSIDVADLDNVVNAARISFFSSDGFYIYEPGYEEGNPTAYAGVLDTNPIDDYYDVVNGHEIVYGEYQNEDKIIYDDVLTENVPVEGKRTCFNAGHFKDNAPFNLEKSLANGLEIAHETSYPLSTLSIDGNTGQYDKSTKQAIAKLYAHIPHRLVVTIYLEGWDTDVTEAIGNAKFTASLAFRGLAAPFNS